MKKILLPVLLCALAQQCFAQEPEPVAPKPANQELGIFGQTESSGENRYMGMTGIQYKRWHNEHLGFRVIGAFAQYGSSGSRLIYAQDDTSFVRQERYNINLPVLGFGLEAQRHFYRNLHLFAALELKGGYGNGSVDTIMTREVGISRSQPPNTEIYGRRDVSLLYVGLTASIGAKLQWRKLALGLELLPVQVDYTRLDDGIRSNGLTNMNIGNISQRLFLHYRF